MKMEWLKTMLKGVWVGATMTVPGVSGGTMAVVVGVYEELIRALDGLRKEWRGNIAFLLQFVLGAGVGFLIFARIVTMLLEHEIAGGGTRLFFCGVVIGGIPLLVRKSGVQKVEGRHLLCLLGGAAVVFCLAKLPQGLLVRGDGLLFYLLQFVAGIIVAIALILPGISVTHILYILGLYEMVLKKVYAFEWWSLFPLAIGIYVGTCMTIRFLRSGLEKYPEEMYMVIIGFVAASLFALMPRETVQVTGVLYAVLGFIGMYLITRYVDSEEYAKHK